MQTTRPRPVAAPMALAALHVGKSKIDSPATAAWQSSDLTWQRNGMLPGMKRASRPTDMPQHSKSLVVDVLPVWAQLEDGSCNKSIAGRILPQVS